MTLTLTAPAGSPHPRREFLLGAATLTALVLAGCGSGDRGGTDPAATDAPGTDGVDAVTADASRILIGGQLLLDAAVALELPIAGVAAPPDRSGVPPYLQPRAGSIEVIPASPEPNYEAVARLGPDLIIGPTEMDDAGITATLTEIAPTVTLDANTANPWPDTLFELGSLTGREEQATAVLDTWEQRVADFRGAVGDRIETEVSLVRCFRDSCRYLPGSTSFAGFVLDQLSVARPGPQLSDPEGRPFVEVSLEQVDLLGGDLIVLFGSDAGDALSALESNALWQQLDAVRADRVREADPFAWFQGSAIAAGVIADDLQAWLLEG